MNKQILQLSAECYSTRTKLETLVKQTTDTFKRIHLIYAKNVSEVPHVAQQYLDSRLK